MAADKRGLEENHPNMIKDKHGKPTASIALKRERLGTFCLEKGQDVTQCTIELKNSSQSDQARKTEGVNGKTQRHHGMA